MDRGTVSQLRKERTESGKQEVASEVRDAKCSVCGEADKRIIGTPSQPFQMCFVCGAVSSIKGTG